MKRYEEICLMAAGWEDRKTNQRPPLQPRGLMMGDVNKVTGSWDRKENTRLGEMEEEKSLQGNWLEMADGDEAITEDDAANAAVPSSPPRHHPGFTTSAPEGLPLAPGVCSALLCG